MWSRVIALGQDALETVLGGSPLPVAPEADPEGDLEGDFEHEHDSACSPWTILRSVLASHTCDSVMKPSFVPVIETNEPSNDAFARLLESEFMVLPVRDHETGEFVGFLKVATPC